MEVIIVIVVIGLFIKWIAIFIKFNNSILITSFTTITVIKVTMVIIVKIQHFSVS